MHVPAPLSLSSTRSDHRRVIGRSSIASIVALWVASSTACGPQIDCEKLCARTLACEVTFGNSDDPEGTRITSGERTDAEACALGCSESPVVTVDSARCIDALEIGSDPSACQADVLQCLDLELPAQTTP